MVVGAAPGTGPERPDLDFLDGLRLEYVVSIVRFFTNASDIRVTGGFVENEDYSRILLLVQGTDNRSLENALSQLTERFDKVVRDEGSERISCYRFSIGSGGLETNFSVVCASSLEEKTGAEFYRV